MLAEGPSGLRGWQSRDSSGKDGGVVGPSSLREGHQSAGCRIEPWAPAELWGLLAAEGRGRVAGAELCLHLAQSWGCL